MATTGDIICATGEDEDIGLIPWVNPGNATADDGAEATAVGTSNLLIARNYSFSIPGGSEILGFTVKVEARETSIPATVTLNAQLRTGVGALVGSAKTAAVAGAVATVYTLGSASDLWGWTPVLATITGTSFGVAFSIAGLTMFIDYVSMAVEYREVGGGNPVILRAGCVL